MRVSKTLISSAAAAAIVSVIGLAYAETSTTGDTAQMQEQTRSDTSTQSAPSDTAAAPTGTMQPSDTPAAPAAPSTGAADAGSASPMDSSTSSAMPSGSGTTSDRSAMPAATSPAPALSGNARGSVNQSNNGGDYNASSNTVTPADGSAATGGAPSDPSPMPAERPAKPDRN